MKACPGLHAFHVSPNFNGSPWLAGQILRSGKSLCHSSIRSHAASLTTDSIWELSSITIFALDVFGSPQHHTVVLLSPGLLTDQNSTSGSKNPRKHIRSWLSLLLRPIPKRPVPCGTSRKQQRSEPRCPGKILRDASPRKPPAVCHRPLPNWPIRHQPSL